MSDDSPWMPPADNESAPGSDGSREIDVAAAPTLPDAPVVPPPPVIAEPSAPAVAPVPPHVQATQPFAPTHGVDFEEAEIVPVDAPPRGPSSRSRWAVGALVAGVVAVGGAGVFAVTNLTKQTSGGAASPDELGFDLLASLENEDVLGAADLLLPGERDVIRDPLVDLVSELTRLEVLSPDADLAAIAGFDIELVDEDVRVKTTNVDDIVNLRVSAEATVTFDGSELPIGDLLDDRVPADAMDEVRGLRETETDTIDFEVTAVQYDGRWYLSPIYTLAEVLRGELGASTGIPFEGIGADGVDDPEVAVDQLLDRVEALDLAGVIRTLNPGEAGALQRYSPLFLEEAQSELNSAVDEVGFSWEITERELRVEGSGATRTAFIDALAIEGRAEGTTFSAAFSGDCATLTVDGEDFESCSGAAASLDDLEEFLPDAEAFRNLIDIVSEALSDMEPSGLELRQFEGQWYISPATTVSEAFLNVLRALDRGELDAIIDAAGPAFDSVGEAVFGNAGSITFDEGFEEAFEEDPSETAADDATDDAAVAADDATAEVAEVADGQAPGWSDCYEVEDPVKAAGCFVTYVDQGEIDEFMVPVELRLNGCGYTEVAWQGGLYDLTDEEFTATIERVRPCVLQVAAQNGVEDWELPSEITHLECFEGRNWYRVFDDSAYDERFSACVSEPGTG